MERGLPTFTMHQLNLQLALLAHSRSKQFVALYDVVAIAVNPFTAFN